MPTPRPRPLVILEDAMLAGLARDQRFVTLFPFLRTLHAPAAQMPVARAGCGSCRANQQRTQSYNSVKAAIAALAPEQLRQLKELLGAKQARVRYRNAGGRVVERTF